MSPDLFHKLSAWLNLSFITLKSKSLYNTKLLEKYSECIAHFLFLIHGIYAGEERHIYKDLCVFITFK